MPTTVEEVKKPAASPSGDSSGEAKSGGGWKVHKPGEGQMGRLGMFVICILFTAFTCHHWYFNWVLLRDLFLGAFDSMGIGGVLSWTRPLETQFWISIIGTAVIFGLGLLIGYHYIYVRTRSAEFLVQTDGELKKVTWPKITPWFKPDTHVWGAAYVVLIVVVAFTVYIMVVDKILTYGADFLFSAK